MRHGLIVALLVWRVFVATPSCEKEGVWSCAKRLSVEETIAKFLNGLPVERAMEAKIYFYGYAGMGAYATVFYRQEV